MKKKEKEYGLVDIGQLFACEASLRENQKKIKILVRKYLYALQLSNPDNEVIPITDDYYSQNHTLYAKTLYEEHPKILLTTDPSFETSCYDNLLEVLPCLTKVLMSRLHLIDWENVRSRSEQAKEKSKQLREAMERGPALYLDRLSTCSQP